MKKYLPIKCLVAALLLGVVGPSLGADQRAAAEKSAAKNRAEFLKKLEEFKSLTPAERAAQQKKMREKTEKRLAELRKKKAAGVITEPEGRQLQRLEAAQENHGKAPEAQPNDKSKDAKPPSHKKAQ